MLQKSIFLFTFAPRKMDNVRTIMKKTILFSSILLLLAGCINDDLGKYSPNIDGTTTSDEGFDFSTVQKVILNVDYSACAPKSAVFFSVYSENPLDGETLNEDVKPIYEGYTNASGKFNEVLELPAYATKLYVYTGNFFINEELIETEVINQMAEAKAGASTNANAPRLARRRAVSTGSGIQTNSLATLYQLSYEVDWRTGDKTDIQKYKEWKTWLGTWDSESGRPSYLLDASDPNYSKLTFTDDEMKGIYQAIAGALEDKKTCAKNYRQVGDLVIAQDGGAEVAVTLVGVNTCWNSTIGYYYYMEGEKPSNTMDLNIVMLFPNAQDGQSKFMTKYAYKYGNDYYGNIALNRGESVKLMYYPEIANGNMTNGSTIFPKGMHIGFILKTNGWGMQKPQGNKKFYNSYKAAYVGDMKKSNIGRQYNVWGASTDGFSYCHYDPEQNESDDGAFDVKKLNPNGEARTAKFAYEDADGKQYAIISFEDACNDDDYDDIILAMKPVGVFEMLPTVKPRVTTTSGVYAFEDLWPEKGDYDMNDAVVDYQEARSLSIMEMGGGFVVTKQAFKLTTYLNYVTKKSGLALTLNTKKAPTSIVMKKIAPDATEETEATFSEDGKVYLLTDNIKDEVGTTYILELNYADGIATSDVATIQPFIYRAEGEKRWEVHIPYEAPSDKMNTAYFGTKDDRSKPDEGIYYVRKGDYPFAFFLSGVNVSPFKKTILVRDNEKKPIDEIYPEFLEWSRSKGTQNKDWYKHPASNQ